MSILCLTALALSAAPLPVAYVVNEEKTIWQPIDPADIQVTVGQAALEALSKSGLVRLEAATDAELRDKPREYVLRITGRMLDEAETHTVFLSFEPKASARLGSLRASDTVVLSKLKRADMLSRIEESAKRAAGDLAKGLKQALERDSQSDAKAPSKGPIEPPPLPWRWTHVDSAPPPSLKADDDLDAKDHKKRQAALRQLTSLALYETGPRQALERCAKKHRDADMRYGCLQALRPLARRLPQTQHAVIEVFLGEKDKKIVSEASDQMLYFTGVSRLEAIQAWLERAAAAEVFGPFQELGDIPNLDTVVLRCLITAGKRPKYERSKRACLDLMDPIPQPRRKAILWRFLQELDPESPYYIEGLGKNEGSSGNDWGWALEHVIEGAERFEPGLEEILWRRYERDFSYNAMSALATFAEPSELMAQRFLELIQTAGENQAARALERFVEDEPKLKPMVREKIAELLATESYHKGVSKQVLEQLLKKASKP